MAHIMTRAAFLRLFALVALAAPIALLGGCDERPDGDTVSVTIKGETFTLETALDDPTRTQGLADRESIDEHGGMIFVFKTAERRYFHMRNCLCDMDIAFLDDASRVTAIYTMTEEPPRLEDEDDNAYQMRLKRYPSRFPAVAAIELRAGKFADLGVEVGDVLDVDLKRLKAMAE